MSDIVDFTSRELVEPAKPGPLARPGEAAAPLIREVRGSLVLGLSALALFFVIGGIWAATAPLSGAVIAPGIVSPESSRQTIQHLEGGIIKELKVREGQRVNAGDPLVVLEDVRARSEVGALTSRLRVLVATETRLRAERAGSESVEFNHPSLLDRDNPDVRASIQAEINQFRTRRENALSRTAILRQRISQLEKQIEGFRRQLKAVKRQFDLIAEEVQIVDGLYKKGMARKPRLLALQRAQAQLLGSEGELVARIARAEEAIGETELQIVNLKIERQEEIDQQLSKVRGERAELEEQIRASLDRLRRTEIRAPVAGTVLGLRYKTTGGVIGPGEPILDLVPLEGDLVIEAKVATNDIDNVRSGQNAYIVFPSFAQRNLKRIGGRVERVSPDALEDNRSGERYYTARVTVDRRRLHEIAPEIELSPGMPAEVFIETGERTMLEYLMQPFLQSVERAFREK